MAGHSSRQPVGKPDVFALIPALIAVMLATSLTVQYALCDFRQPTPQHACRVPSKSQPGKPTLTTPGSEHMHVATPRHGLMPRVVVGRDSARVERQEEKRGARKDVE